MPPKLSEEVRQARARERKARWRQQVATNQNQPQVYIQQQQQQEVQFIATSISQARLRKSASPELALPEPPQDDYLPDYDVGESRATSPSPSQSSISSEPSRAREPNIEETELSEDEEDWLGANYSSEGEDGI